jgi:MoaA/NifB/PqqE/SkfB family radical SAM enzyme
VDGPAAVHNRIRGGRDSFERLYRGVELVNATKARLKRRHPLIRFSFTVTDENYTQVLEFIQAVEPLHPASINISQLNFITEGMARAHNARYGGDLAVVPSSLGTMDPADFETGAIWAELERVRAYARSRGRAFPALTIIPDFAGREGLDTFYREPLTFVGGRHCTDPWKMMMIKTDGAVIPSHGRCYNFPVGNIQTSPLPDLWNNDRFRTFRQTLRQAGGTLPACARCCGVIGKPPSGRASHAPQPV